MDKEAFDAFAQNGFLYDLDQLLNEYKKEQPDPNEYTDEQPDPNEARDEQPDPDEYTKDSPDLISKTEGYLVRNMEIKEDNAKEIALDPAAEPFDY